MLTPVDKLIPHRPPMRWLDALVECTETTATATVCFPADSAAVAEGLVLEAALVECVAQTVAAAAGARAARRGHLGQGMTAAGMLVSVSNFTIHRRPTAAEPLLIHIRELKRLGLMLRVAGEVTGGAQSVAAGELTLYA
jgi:predicted hotdog family 3-hydroxylacyl-ACP dehydratase